MKKGFTLVEIILSIALITIIGISGFFMYKTDKKEKTLEKMKEDIYRAVNVLIETDGETKKQLYNSKNGAIIPLAKLESEGLIDFNGLDIKDEYVLSMLGSEEESEKCSGTLYNIGSWTKAKDDVIYICGSENLSPEVKDYIDKKVDEINGTSDVLKEAIINNAKKADGTTARSVIDLNNIITTETINTLSKINDEYVFKRNTIDNYVNFNGKCFRATRIQKDGSIKLLLQDKNSTCDGENYDESWSIGKGHFGYTANYVMSGFEHADYLNGETDKQNSMKYLLEKWFDENFNVEKKSYLKENTWTIEDVSSPISLLNYRGEVTARGKVDELLSESYGTSHWAVYEKNTTFNSYVATMRGEEYQPYMNSGTNDYMFLNIDAIAFPSHSVISYIDMSQPFVYHGKFYNYGNLVFLGMDCTAKLDIRPMIVLNDGLKISGGVGTQINPYVIAE